MPALVQARRRRKRKPKKRAVVRRPVATAPKPAPKPAPQPAPSPSPTPAPVQTAPKPTPTPQPQPQPQPQPTTPAPSTQPSPAPSTQPSTQPSPPPSTQPTGPAVALVATPTMAGTLQASARERLFLNRFGTGFSQRSLAQLRSVGTPEQWLAAQLTPSRFVEHPRVAAVDGWFSSLLGDEPAERWRKQISGEKGGWIYGHELGCWSMLRRIYSERTVLEKMTDFWSASLHVPVGHDRAWIWRFDYDRAIREHALGRFEDLLLATALHPAMLLYLDNFRSVRDKPNENQGRELLELHTVGRAAGYTEAMVKDSAKLLSGYTVDWGETFEPFYKTAAHTTGAVNVMGFTHANTSANGAEVTKAYLRHLARHPATAQRVCRRLATFLVSDTPSQGLVDALARVYLDSGTSISAVLTALAAHPEFAGSTGQRVRNPIEDVVATARVLEVDANKAPISGDGDDSYARHVNYTHSSTAVFSWPRPDGPPLAGSAWATPSRMFNSYSMHWAHAGGWWPKGAAYKAPTHWLPRASLTFDELVEHLSRRWLGKSADARTRQQALQALASSSFRLTPTTTVTESNGVVRWLFVRLTGSLLDSPDHMAS